ncbi:MAG: amidohydrolase family protein [Streptosporangiales bacterium]|nr:amidohydrolase family protein [Streptosporangiales bacterium]
MPHRFPALIAAPPAAAGRLWLLNARVFDGTGTNARPGSAVLVEDGMIRHVCDTGDVPADPGTERRIDLGGRTLLPGLTNAHTHLAGGTIDPKPGAEEMLPNTPTHFLQAALRDMLRMGVTTLRNTGSQGLQPQEARQAMRYGAFRGPRILTCGKIISATAPGGRFYGDMYQEVDGPDGVRNAVRTQVRWGADFVKVMTTGARSNELEDPEPTQFTDGELAAAVDEAHRLGYRVCAHAEGLDGTAAAIAHGMDTIEHGMFLNQRPELLDQMAENGQFLVPTLTGYYYWAGYSLDVIDPTDAPTNPEADPMLSELGKLNLAEGAKSMRAAREAGVKIALGSDRQGEVMSTSGELLRMIHHGLTVREALVAATKTAAEALGLDDHVGTVEEGKLADLVVVDGDVLSQPALLADRDKIWLVLQLGEPVAGAAMEQPMTTDADTPALAGVR